MTESEFRNLTVVVVSASLPIATPWSPAGSGHSLHIGAACMRAFASYGAQVIVIDTSDETLSQLEAEQLGSSSANVRFIRSDCCTFKDLSAVASQLGAGNVLVNCHSYPQAVSIESADPGEIEDAVRFDLLGPLMAAKAFLPNLERAGEATIVNVGSIDGILGNPAIPVYSMNKEGLIALTHVMAEEFANKGIRTSYVARGMTVHRGTPQFEKYAPLIAQTPLGRPAYPDEVADSICFLASKRASYINGVVLPVDGGRSVITQGTRRLSDPIRSQA